LVDNYNPTPFYYKSKNKKGQQVKTNYCDLIGYYFKDKTSNVVYKVLCVSRNLQTHKTEICIINKDKFIKRFVTLEYFKKNLKDNFIK